MEMRLSRRGAAFRNCRRAFAFTFLAFFLAMVILAFVHLSLLENEYTKENVYKESRISFVDNELKYFKQTYLPNAISYSLYNALAALQDYSRNPANYAKFEGNYSKFNEFLLEGMKYGSFNGTLQPLLYDDNRTVAYFLDVFRDDFNNNFKANFTFDILNLNVYEEKPYYITARLYTNLSVTTEDNISSWSSLEFIDVAVPIYDLNDPLFLIFEDEEVTIRASEFKFNAQNWTIENFEEALNETYASVYYEPNHMYTLGDSYINRFLNISTNSYLDVLGFWSFDYDLDKKRVYDSAGFSNVSKSFANTRLELNFDNESIIGFKVPDLSPYENNASVYGSPDCNSLGVDFTACNYDGIDDYLLVSSGSMKFSGPFSFSVWINPDSIIQSDEFASIFRMSKGTFTATGTKDGFALRYQNTSSQADFIIGNTTESSYVTSDNISANKWAHLVGVFNTTHLKIYQDGFLIESSPTDIRRVEFLTNNLSIGGWHDMGNDFFNGSIDELSFFSKALSDSEVADLYSERKVLDLDYVDSFHGKGVDFDGVDDRIFIDDNPYLDVKGNMSLEIWFKPEFFNGSNQSLVYKYDGSGYGIDLINRSPRFFVTTTVSGFCSCRTPTVINPGKWYLFTGVYDRTSGNMYSYVNGKLVNNTCSCTGDIDDNNAHLIFGGNEVGSDFFAGVIDEVKLYNYSLNKEQVRNNYYNYDSLAKGCCNYITLLDPHKFGSGSYVDPLYATNTSYSSKMFYNYHRRGIRPNIVLWNISTITSYDVSNEYYNFILDQCMVDAFNVLDYMNETLSVDYHKQSGVDMGSCSELVEYGFY